MINALRRLLYRSASLLGDMRAVQRGPQAIAARLVRKALLRNLFKVLR